MPDAPTAPLPVVRLRTSGHTDQGGVSTAEVTPGRGAIVTRWSVAGRELLYLDEPTLTDASKNVRGGVPLLFPAPGKLEDGRYRRGDVSGAMKQHGFARDLPWDVVRQSEDSVTLSLASSEATRAFYPWDFAASLTVSLAPSALRLAVAITNKGGAPMPFGFGIHPYFLVHDKAGATILTGATRAFDNVTGKTGPFRGFSLATGETDLHLIDHGSTDSALTADGGRVTLHTSPEFRRWVVWTLPGKDFVCVEPWTSPGNALNTGEGLLELAAGAKQELRIDLSFSQLSAADGPAKGAL